MMNNYININNLNINKEKFKDNRDLANLLDYYRIKLDKFDQERSEWMEKLELLRNSQEEKHKLEWELETRNQEILNLQTNKTEINRTINLERQRMSQMISEIEFYKERSNQDRNRMLQLLQLTDPIEQHLVLQPGKKPEILERFNMTPFNNSSVDIKKVINKTVDLNYSTQIFNSSQIMKTTKDNTSKELSKSLGKINFTKRETKEKINKNRSNSNTYKKIKVIHSSSKERIKPSSEKQHIIRSIVLPNNDKNEMVKEVEFLKNQIQDLRNFSEDQLRKQQTIAKEYETELKLHLENEKQKYSELLKSKQKCEEVSILLTKELLNIKSDYANTERKIYEELDLSKLQNQALITAMKELSNVKELDKENYLIEQERKTNQILNNLRTQLRNYQENVRIMKEQYRQIQAIFNSRMNELIDNYNKLLDKNKELETKFFKNVATSGSSHFIKASKSIGKFDNMTLLVSEINNLNKRIKQLENMDLSKDPNLEIEKTKPLVITKSKSLVKFTNKQTPLAKKSSKLKIENNNQSINFPSKEIDIKIEPNDSDRKISEPNSTKNKLLKSLKPSEIRKKMKEKAKENDTKEKKESRAASVTKDNSKKGKVIGELKKQFGEIENMVNSMK